MELMKTFIPQQKELELFGLFDSCKPYTRNVIHDSTKFTLCLYCWNPGAESKIHDHPCDLCLVLPLSGSLKVERYDAMTMAIDNVRFYLEGQVATLSNANGVFRITNPRRYVSAMSLSLLSPSYRTHTTWVSPTAPPKLTRIGTFSIRGIRTPRLEARLGLHGQLLVELKERAVLIPADKNMRPDGHRGGEAGGGGSSSDDVLKAQSLVTKSGVYKLGEHVGRGAYGNVYQALNKTTGTFAAVKVIPAPYEDAESERHMAKILSEIQFLESCVHPNIVRYYEAIRFHNSFYIFTEFMESKSIQHILQQYGTFDESLTRTYLKQILSGLGYLHERGVIHRDVKGANVLVAKDGLVKLADFGVALQVRDEPNIADRTTVRSNGGKEPEVVGTPYWMGTLPRIPPTLVFPPIQASHTHPNSLISPLLPCPMQPLKSSF
jgi:hypothetical protein